METQRPDILRQSAPDVSMERHWGGLCAIVQVKAAKFISQARKPPAAKNAAGDPLSF